LSYVFSFDLIGAICFEFYLIYICYCKLGLIYIGFGLDLICIYSDLDLIHIICCEFDSTDIRCFELDLFDIGSSELDLFNIGFFELDLFDICSSEVGLIDIIYF